MKKIWMFAVIAALCTLAGSAVVVDAALTRGTVVDGLPQAPLFEAIAEFQNSLTMRCTPSPPGYACCLDDWQAGSGCPAGTRLTGTCDASCNNCGPLSCVSVTACPTCFR